jgi:hypothetical protein
MIAACGWLGTENGASAPCVGSIGFRDMHSSPIRVVEPHEFIQLVHQRGTVHSLYSALSVVFKIPAFFKIKIDFYFITT